MNKLSKIQQIFLYSYEDFQSSDSYVSGVQEKAAHAILNCKSGSLGYNITQCSDCGHMEFHNNSCRNRNCPNCQAILKEFWIDKRRAEVIDSPYFHVVFTVPHELNPLIYGNQKLLYSLLHRCSSETLLELARDTKYLGATPGIIQVLHTWGQTLNFHPHIHCIVSGGGLSVDQKSSQMWRKVLYSSSRNGKSISWKVSLLSAKVLCHRQTCFLVFLCRTSEFLLLE